MRVALFAYSCIPFAGSEFGLGWQWVQLAARSHDLTVFTPERNREAIEAFGRLDNVRFEYVALRDRVGPIRNRREAANTVHCVLWYRRAVKRALQLHRQRQFDLAHQATMSAYWLPTPLWELAIPIVVGPVTGAEQTHPAFLNQQPMANRMADRLRQLFLRRMVKSADWRKTNLDKSTLVVATTENVERLLIQQGAPNVERFRPSFAIFAGLSDQLERVRRQVSKSQVPTFVTAGRQVHWKGQDLALRAFALVLEKLPDAIFHLIGNGVEHQRLVKLVKELGIAASVKVHRRVDRNEERCLIAQSHLFLFPSRRDGGATVPVFAMALGTPLVGFDVGALNLVVGDSARLIDPSRAGEPPRALADSLLEIYGDAELRAELARRGRTRVREVFTDVELQEALERWYATARLLANDRTAQENAGADELHRLGKGDINRAADTAA